MARTSRNRRRAAPTKSASDHLDQGGETLALVTTLAGLTIIVMTVFTAVMIYQGRFTREGDTFASLSPAEQKVREVQAIRVVRVDRKMPASFTPRPFSFGPFSIGMSIDTFLGTDRDGRIIRGPDGGKVGVLTTETGAYQVSFLPAVKSRRAETSQPPRAYRIGYQQVFRQTTEREILSHLGDRWGNPTGAKCGRRTYEIAYDCRFTWWPEDGTRVVADLRTEYANRRGDTRTTLRIEAVDTRAAIKRRQAGLQLAGNDALGTHRPY